MEVCASEYKCRKLVDNTPMKMKIAFSVTAVLVIAVIIMCLTWKNNKWVNCRKSFAKCCKCCYREEEQQENKFVRQASFF